MGLEKNDESYQQKFNQVELAGKFVANCKYKSYGGGDGGDGGIRCPT